MKIPENITIVVKALLPLVIVIILFIIVGQFGFGKIVEIQGKVSQAQSDQRILTQKLDILQNVSVTGKTSSNLAMTDLPDSNPSLSAISQIKYLTLTNDVILGRIKSNTSPVTSSGLSFVTISFTIMGSRQQIESFVLGVNTLAPISVVDKIKIAESGPELSNADISLKFFWAPLPTEVPAITSAISDLSPSEAQLLVDLGKLQQPQFSQVAADQSGGKADPFSP